KVVSLQANNSQGAMSEGAGQAWDPHSGMKSWTIASFTNAQSESILASFALDLTQFQNTNLGGITLVLGNGGTTLDVQYVPEPTGATILLLSGMGLLSRRNRRRRAVA